MNERRFGARPYIEAVAALLLLLATAFFAISILDSQDAYSDDRAGLMSLKESWGAVAAGYGLRGNVLSSSAEFVEAYKAFRERPSVKRLIADDTAFAASAGRVDAALARLEAAESLGGARAAQNPSRYATILDEALGDMARRVTAFSKSRLSASRVSLAVLILLVFALGSAFFFLERRILHESAEGEGSRALAQALISAQEAERLRLSHQLHDAVAQDLAAAKLYCSLAAAADPKAESDSKRAVNLLDRSIGELRDICQGLRPAELDKLGVADACAQLCAETASAAGFEVSYAAEGFEGLSLGEDLEINIYRVLQEALNNVRRHAKARRVDVLLLARTVSIRLRVEDDGVGPGTSQPGLGRRGMEERARMLGGGMEVTQGPRGGDPHIGLVRPSGKGAPVKKSVFVIDDHTAIREGFKVILERSGAYSVAGEASSAEELLSRLDGGEAFPDLFIVDISLPGMGGIELVSVLRSRTTSPIVILSMHRRYDYIVRAFRAGASGYVAKDAGVECIVSALGAATSGGAYLDPASLRLFVDEVTSGRRSATPVEESPPGPDSFPALSDREEEVFRLLASGKRAEEIAAALGLSQKTVENHLSNMTTKLGAHNRFELYRIAARLGQD